MSLVSTAWKTLSKKLLVKNQFIELWEDLVLGPDGKQSKYYILRRDAFSIVIPIQNKKVFLVNQYRYTVASLSLEFPMGYVPDRTPREIAELELKQETGITAHSLTEIGKFWLANGFTNEVGHVFVAEELTFGKPETEEGEFIEMQEYPIEELEKMIEQGKIIDGPSIIAYHFLEKHLQL